MVLHHFWRVCVGLVGVGFAMLVAVVISAATVSAASADAGKEQPGTLRIGDRVVTVDPVLLDKDGRLLAEPPLVNGKPTDAFLKAEARLKEQVSGQTKAQSDARSQHFENLLRNVGGDIRLLPQNVQLQPNSSAGSLCDTSGSNNIPFNYNQRGDEINIAGASNGMYGRYCHTAIWNYSGQVIEARQSGGVQFGPSNRLRDEALHTVVLRVNAIASDRERAERRAENFLGRPYNYIFTDKTTYDRFYCSQLAWRSFIDTTGLDQDSNGGAAVSPDDIYYSDKNSIVVYR